MITAYHRPDNIQDALKLIARPFPHTLPLGGGTLLSHGPADDIEVVDLQYLGLDQIHQLGNNLQIGAAASLQHLLEDSHCTAALFQALRLEAPLNIRYAATVAGTLVACDGRSTLATVLLSLDAKLSLESALEAPGAQNSTILSLGDLLPLRKQLLAGKLITRIEIPLNASLAFEYVSRTPADKPIICVALARWPSGRTRLAVGGFAKTPTLAMDGTEAEGLATAAQNACHDANDDWGSAEYRMEIAGTLSKRCLASLSA